MKSTKIDLEFYLIQIHCKSNEIRIKHNNPNPIQIDSITSSNPIPSNIIPFNSNPALIWVYSKFNPICIMYISSISPIKIQFKFKYITKLTQIQYNLYLIWTQFKFKPHPHPIQTHSISSPKQIQFENNLNLMKLQFESYLEPIEFFFQF